MKITAAIARLALLLAAGAAQASPVTWLAPTAITSADQALHQGSGVEYAVAWTGGTATTTVTLADSSTVAFQAGQINGTGLVQVSGAMGICGGGCAAYNGTSNANFNAAMGGFAFDGTQSIMLTGLTIGQDYLVQLFSLDDRSCCASKTQIFRDQSGNTTQSFAHSANDFVIGKFTADATAQRIIGVGQTSSACSQSICSNLNAVVLYDAAVPEPASWALVGLALVALRGARRMRRPAR